MREGHVYSLFLSSLFVYLHNHRMHQMAGPFIYWTFSDIQIHVFTLIKILLIKCYMFCQMSRTKM